MLKACFRVISKQIKCIFAHIFPLIQGVPKENAIIIRWAKLTRIFWVTLYLFAAWFSRINKGIKHIYGSMLHWQGYELLIHFRNATKEPNLLLRMMKKPAPSLWWSRSQRPMTLEDTLVQSESAMISQPRHIWKLNVSPL